MVDRQIGTKLTDKTVAPTAMAGQGRTQYCTMKTSHSTSYTLHCKVQISTRQSNDLLWKNATYLRHPVYALKA